MKYLIIARITLKSTDQGGRTNPIYTGYRPNNVFEPGNGAWISEITFSDVDHISPGETHLVEVQFLHPDTARFLTVGRKWLICEGLKEIGEGEIISIN